MATAYKDIRVSAEQYLEAEARSEVRHEYADGFVVAQAGASRTHNLIAVTVSSFLRAHLKGSSCRTYVSDMKVRICAQDLDLFYYPDVMVSCDENPQSEYYEDKPCILIEVLSDSTESKDRLEKLNAYSKIPSLKEYILISQNCVAVDVYRRSGSSFDLERLSDGDTLRIESIGLEQPVKDIYEDVLGLIG
ncbi:Uma2 family endonuclease [Alkalimarinus coralli]|uniref:Uma2 family endonuclease n=1 Tax=Alkalimarinus coralli TaxID=2935863 RepID=UPI00202B3757|nr:Uma2 family endonuclease [Alkalimarinus coralli]